MLSFVIAATSRTGQRLLLAAEQLISCCALRSAWEGPLSLKFRSEPGYYFGYFGDTKFGWFRTGFSCEGVAYCWKQSLAAWASKHEVGLAWATFWGSRKPPKVVISLSTSYKNQVAEQSSTKIFRKGLFGSFWTAMSSPSHFLGWFWRGFWRHLGPKTGSKNCPERRPKNDLVFGPHLSRFLVDFWIEMSVFEGIFVDVLSAIRSSWVYLIIVKKYCKLQ